jgi:hypothetical protein
MDARCWAECGIEGKLEFVPGSGWCNSGGDNQGECQSVFNGTSKSGFDCDNDCTFVTDSSGFSRGSPSYGSIGIFPQLIIETWLMAASAIELIGNFPYAGMMITP